MEFAGLVLEGAAPEAGAAVPIFGLAIVLSWATIGGIAFSPWFGFPPIRPTAADLVWIGGARGAGVGLLASAVAVVAWAVFNVGGLGQRELIDVGDAWAWVGTFGGFSLAGFFLGAVFALLVGRSP